ncbi:MAG: adenylyl-sulfate kinase [Desulfobulbus oligotrophicus]|jgi:bifunctional enzyme CysN/CysC|nr:adenylyl-sulfate kinase [Desulfobulbus oligotrophicus]
MTPGKKKYPSPIEKPFCETDTTTNGELQQIDPRIFRLIIFGGMEKEQEALLNHLFQSPQQVIDNQQAALERATKNIVFFDTTSNLSYRHFNSTQRKYIVATVSKPGQYLDNMVCDAFIADVAVVLVDASAQDTDQVMAYMCRAWLVGIRHVILAMNNADAVFRNQQNFEDICTTYKHAVEPLGFKSVTTIALSVLTGDNIISLSDKMPWYTGQSLLSCLDNLQVESSSDYKVMFLVQNSDRNEHGLSKVRGVVATGELCVGEQLQVLPSGDTGRVVQIDTPDGNVDSVNAGETVTLILDRTVAVTMGDVLMPINTSFEMSDQFQATLFWMHKDIGLSGRRYLMKLANQKTNAWITNIKHLIDINTNAQLPSRQLELHDIAVCNLALSHPVYFDTVQNTLIFGSFILMDRFEQTTVAVGFIRHYLRRSRTVHQQALSITRQDRERLNRHRGKVIWLTGLSGAGKSTLANRLEKQLYASGRRTYVLDGDNIRQGLNRDLGFTEAARVENIRRVAEVARLMMDAGLVVITAFISPFRAERRMARELIGAENFVEVFVDTPLEVCEKRDPKGLYQKARDGRLPNMTGIDSPYEPPDNPTVVFKQNSSIQEILALLKLDANITD